MEPFRLEVGPFLLFLLVGGAPCFLAALIYSAVGQRHVPDDYWVDKFWGDGSIDDDDWGLAVFRARQAGDKRRIELAQRNGPFDSPRTS